MEDRRTVVTIDAILQKETLTHSDLVTLLGTTDAGQRKKLYDAAYAVKLKYIGNVDHYRRSEEHTSELQSH